MELRCRLATPAGEITEGVAFKKLQQQIRAMRGGQNVEDTKVN